MKNKRLLIAFFLVGCSDSAVNLVQDLSISPEHNKSISEVLDDRGICSSSRWTSYEQDEKQTIVEYRCELSGAKEYYKSVFLNLEAEYEQQRDQNLKSYQLNLKELDEKLKLLAQKESQTSKHLHENEARILDLEKSKDAFVRDQRDKLFHIEKQISDIANEASLISDEIQLLNYSSRDKNRNHSRVDTLISEYNTLKNKISKLKQSRYSLPKFETTPDGFELNKLKQSQKQLNGIKEQTAEYQTARSQLVRNIQLTTDQKFVPPLVPKKTFEVWKWAVPKNEEQVQVIYSAVELISDKAEAKNKTIMFDNKSMIEELQRNKKIVSYRDYDELIEKVQSNG